MDPVTALGAAGSVVGIASFGLQLCQALYQFTSEARAANESLVAVVSGIQATTLALNQVHGFLKEEVEHLKTKSRATFFTPSSIHAVKKTADECLVIFWKIEATIAHKTHSNIEEELIRKLEEFNEQLLKEERPPPIITDKKLTSMSIWNRLRWPMITYKLDQFNAQLQSRQNNLNLIFTVVSLGAQRVKPNQRQEDLEFIAETFAKLRRMAAQGEIPQFETIAEYRRKRKDLSHRNRPQLESPADEKLRADSLPIGAAADPFRRSSHSPSRRLSPLRYSFVSSKRNSKKSLDVPILPDENGPETIYLNMSEIPDRRSNQVIPEEIPLVMRSKSPIPQPGNPEQKETSVSTKSFVLSQDALLSGGRSENDPPLSNDGDDHVYENDIDKPAPLKQSTALVEPVSRASSPDEDRIVSADAEHLDAIAPAAEETNEIREVGNSGSEPAASPIAEPLEASEDNVVLNGVQQLTPEILQLSSAEPLNGNEPQRNGTEPVVISLGTQTELSSSNVILLPFKEDAMPETIPVSAGKDRAKVDALPTPDIVLETPSQHELESPPRPLSEVGASATLQKPSGDSMALVLYHPVQDPTQQQGENLSVADITSLSFRRIRRRERREKRRERERLREEKREQRRQASPAKLSSTHEDAQPEVSMRTPSYRSDTIRDLRRYRFAALFKSLFRRQAKGKGSINSRVSLIETEYETDSEKALSTNEQTKRFAFLNAFSRTNGTTYDATVRAYIIKNGQSHRVPHSGTLRLTRQQIKNLESQPSQQPWYKLFAFLDKEDREALKLILSGGNRAYAVKRRVIHLEKVKEDRLKFWKVRNQALFALVTELSPEAPSIGDSFSLADDPSSPPNEYQSPVQTAGGGNTRNPGIALPPPTSATPFVQIWPGATGHRPDPMFPGRQHGLPLEPAPLRLPQGVPHHNPLPGPPPPPPPLRSSIVTRNVAPQPVLDEAACRAQLTTWLLYNIRKCLPSSPFESATWAKSEVTEEKVSQADILNYIKMLDKTNDNVSQKKAELAYFQQRQLTYLLDNLTMREQDRNFEWLLAQIDRIERPIDGTKDKRETTVMLVFVKRAPLQSLSAITVHQNLERAKLGPHAVPGIPWPPTGAQPPVGGPIPQPQGQNPPPKPPQSSSGPTIVKPKSSKPRPKSKKRGDDTYSDSDFDTYSSFSWSSDDSLGTRRRPGRFRKRNPATSTTRTRSRSRYYRRSPRSSRTYGDMYASAYRAGQLDADTEYERELRRGAGSIIPDRSRSYYDRQDAFSRRPYSPPPPRVHSYPARPPPGPVVLNSTIDREPNQYTMSKATSYPEPYYESERLNQPIIRRPEPGPLTTSGNYGNATSQSFGKPPAKGDNDGRDIVQQLLLEWTPRNGDEASNENEESMDEDEGGVQTKEKYFDIDTTHRSTASAAATAGSYHSSKLDSRQATVDDVLDEADQKRPTPRPDDVLSEDGNMIFPERGRQHSPKPILKPRASSEGPGKASWLDPSWAKEIVDTTSKTVEPPKRKGTGGIRDEPIRSSGSNPFLPDRGERPYYDPYGYNLLATHQPPTPAPPPPPRPDAQAEDEISRKAASERAKVIAQQREVDEYMERPHVSYNRSTLDREEARERAARRREAELRELEREEKIRQQDEEIRSRDAVPIPRRPSSRYADGYYSEYGRDRRPPVVVERESGYYPGTSYYVSQPPPPRRRSRRYIGSDDEYGW